MGFPVLVMVALASLVFGVWSGLGSSPGVSCWAMWAVCVRFSKGIHSLAHDIWKGFETLGASERVGAK